MNINWTINYFSARVQKEIQKWPVSLYAEFLRLMSLMEERGADLRLPHSRAIGDGLFVSYLVKGKKASVEYFTAQ